MLSKTTDSGATWSTGLVILDPGQNDQTIGNQVVVPTAGPGKGVLVDGFDLITTKGGKCPSIPTSPDRGISTGVTIRPGLESALSACAATRGAVLGVAKLDRRPEVTELLDRSSTRWDEAGEHLLHRGGEAADVAVQPADQHRALQGAEHHRRRRLGRAGAPQTAVGAALLEHPP